MAKKDSKNIKVTLEYGLIGATKLQIATAKALGLSKRGKSNIVPMDEACLGKIRKIEHLVKVEEI